MTRRSTTASTRRRKRATRADAEGFIRQAFIDRISWTAARLLLEEAYPYVVTAPMKSTEKRTPSEIAKSIKRFLDDHPAPPPPESRT
jgi:hypothetical protein